MFFFVLQHEMYYYKVKLNRLSNLNFMREPIYNIYS